MAFTYFLPDENGNKTEHETTSNAVIIIGANGSGKSKLGHGSSSRIWSKSTVLGHRETLTFGKTSHSKAIHRQRTLFSMEQMINRVNAVRDTVGSGENILPN